MTPPELTPPTEGTLKYHFHSPYIVDEAATEAGRESQASEARKALGDRMGQIFQDLPEGDYLLHYAVHAEHTATDTKIAPTVSIEAITVVNSHRIPLQNPDDGAS